MHSIEAAEEFEGNVDRMERPVATIAIIPSLFGRCGGAFSVNYYEINFDGRRDISKIHTNHLLLSVSYIIICIVHIHTPNRE